MDKIYILMILIFLCFKPIYALEIYTSEEPPVNYQNNDNQIVGISIDIVSEIKRRLNEKSPIRLLPWARSYYLGKKNPNTLLFTVGKTQERIDLEFTFLGPVISRKHSLFKRKNSLIVVRNLKDLNKYIISGMRNDWRTEWALENSLKVDQSNRHIYGLKMLLKSRVDLFISSEIELIALCREAGIRPDELSTAYLIKEAPSYFMFSKGTDPKIIEAWKKTFEDMKKGTFFVNLAKKWTKILGESISWNDAKGFRLTSPLSDTLEP